MLFVLLYLLYPEWNGAVIHKGISDMHGENECIFMMNEWDVDIKPVEYQKRRLEIDFRI